MRTSHTRPIVTQKLLYHEIITIKRTPNEMVANIQIEITDVCEKTLAAN